MPIKTFPVKGTVEIFPVKNPWVYIRVPQKYTKMFAHLADRGLIAITATLSMSSWKTSLMPMGDGTHFIPLPAKVRKKASIAVGDRVTLAFSLRTRHATKR